jgi:hypothetical protein
MQDPQDAGFEYGDHSIQCPGGGSLHRRHDRLKVVLYAALRSGGYSPQLEPLHLIPGRLTRPGDVYVPVGDNGLGVAYDATVVSPLLRPTLTSTTRTPGHAVAAAEQRKASLYTSACAAVDIRLVPLAQETFGGWSGMASHQICLISDSQSDRTGAPRSLCRNALFRALSVATQRSIALGFIDRSGLLPEHAPLFPPVPASVPPRVPSCFKDRNILCFRLNKQKSISYHFSFRKPYSPPHQITENIT